MNLAPTGERRRFDFKNVYTGYKTIHRVPVRREKFYLLYGERGGEASWIECSEGEYLAYRTHIKRPS